MPDLTASAAARLAGAFTVFAVFFATAFFGTAFFGTAFLTIAFLVAAFFEGATFFVAAFFAAAFFVAVFLATAFRGVDGFVATFFAGVVDALFFFAGAAAPFRGRASPLAATPRPADFSVRERVPLAGGVVLGVFLPPLERCFATPPAPRMEGFFRYFFGMKVTPVSGPVNAFSVLMCAHVSPCVTLL